MSSLSTSLFLNFTENKGTASLDEILQQIKSDVCKKEIENIRKLTSEGNKDGADKLKHHLPAFTPSGVFSNGRKLDLLKTYNPVIGLDFDNVNGELPALIEKVNAIPTTYCSFISPRGNGLKVFVITNSTQDSHLSAFNQVADLYEQETGIKSDRSVKDIPRLCFFSYDPNLFLNPESQVFQVTEQPKNPTNNSEPLSDYASIFEACVLQTVKSKTYHNGDRNNFIYALACNCNRRGIPLEQAVQLCSQSYDLNVSELNSAIKSAYNKYRSEFAASANVASLQHQEEPIPDDNFLKKTPSIDNYYYDQMPEIIKKGVIAFTDPRERDVFFTGALSILSGCLPNVEGVYNRQTVYPNLFSFVIAPPASGKGALKFSRALGNKIQESMLLESQESQKSYERNLRAYKLQMSKKNADVSLEPPKAPPFKVFFIPANSSYAKILTHLYQNDGAGIICETEADTMGNIFKQEWGSYSDMLRKAFHHEPISSSRKTNNEYIEVPLPRLSVALTGTPGQIAGLISSSEDGLFSRFFFYIFKADPVWHDVSPQPNLPNLTDFFNDLSEEVSQMVNYMHNTRLQFHLTPDQWSHLNDSFSFFLSNITTFTSDNAASIVKRLGLLLYRLAMIFTAIRKYENRSTEVEIYCTDNDFNLALHLSESYLIHSLIMYNNLPKEDSTLVFSEAPNKKAFFNALPDSFTRAEAIELGNDHHMSTRTVDAFLKQLLDSKLEKVANGKYTKK